MKAALNEPTLEDVTVVGVVDCVIPSYLMMMVEEAAKPVPDTVTVPPTMPLDGFKLIAALMVNMALAEWVATSVAVMVWAPFVETGAVKVALNEPMVEEATVVGDVATVVPSYLMVMVEEAAKPVPVMVITVPVGPPVGLSAIEAVTEKVAEAVRDNASVAVTVWAPNIEAGTVNDEVNRPEASVPTVATVEELNVSVTVDEGVKLVPETVTGEPTVPDVGLRVIPGLSVKVAVAEWEKASVAVTL